MNNQDFKYVMQDLTNLYIGAKLSYEELMNLDETPFKLKAIISHYMLREVAGDTTLENHIFYMKETDLSYMVLNRMKARFRLSYFDQDGHGKRKPGYVSREFRIDEILQTEELHSRKDEIVVEELHLTKLSLLSVSI